MVEDMMRAAAAAAWPNEACGLILQVGKKSVSVLCANTSEEPGSQFLISVEDYCDAAARGEVIGVWHTHVNTSPKPSQADLVGCEASGVPWFILSAYKNEVGEISFSEIEKVEPSGFELPYIGRPYVFGVLDCWSLVQDYYRREYQIKLDSFPRIPEFWQKGNRFFEENWETQGFVRLLQQEPIVGDTFLMQTSPGGVVNHVAVYVGDGLMLHHAHGRLSRRDVYGGHWLKHTSHHLRHKTKC